MLNRVPASVGVKMSSRSGEAKSLVTAICLFLPFLALWPVCVCRCPGNLFTVRCTSCQQVQPNNDSPICEALRDKGYQLILFQFSLFIIFRVMRSRGKMFIGHGRLSVCVCVCLFILCRIPTLVHGPRNNLGEWCGVPPSCVILGGLQLVHGFGLYGNICA